MCPADGGPKTRTIRISFALEQEAGITFLYSPPNCKPRALLHPDGTGDGDLMFFLQSIPWPELAVYVAFVICAMLPLILTVTMRNHFVRYKQRSLDDDLKKLRATESSLVKSWGGQ